MRMWLLCVLPGCFVGGAGTAVGNPGDGDVQARAVDPDVVLDEVLVPVARWEGDPCHGARQVRRVDDVLDGLGPSPVPFPIPPGDFCDQALILAGPISVVGHTAAGTAWSLDLDVGTLEGAGRVAVDGDRLLFAFPVTVDAAVIDAEGCRRRRIRGGPGGTPTPTTERTCTSTSTATAWCRRTTRSWWRATRGSRRPRSRSSGATTAAGAAGRAAAAPGRRWRRCWRCGGVGGAIAPTGRGRYAPARGCPRCS
ncbi:MAG: hypothetical protein R3F59_37015 [Myxococcota bacterium]